MLKFRAILCATFGCNATDCITFGAFHTLCNVNPVTLQPITLRSAKWQQSSRIRSQIIKYYSGPHEEKERRKKNLRNQIPSPAPHFFPMTISPLGLKKGILMDFLPTSQQLQALHTFRGETSSIMWACFCITSISERKKSVSFFHMCCTSTSIRVWLSGYDYRSWPRQLASRRDGQDFAVDCTSVYNPFKSLLHCCWRRLAQKLRLRMRCTQISRTDHESGLKAWSFGSRVEVGSKRSIMITMVIKWNNNK